MTISKEVLDELCLSGVENATILHWAIQGLMKELKVRLNERMLALEN